MRTKSHYNSFGRLASLAALASLAFWPGVVAYGITNGQPDGERHPYVAMTFNGSFTCSGVAVSPKVIVTAAHCAISSGARVSVTFDSQADPAIPPTWHEGTIFPHPENCFGCTPGPAGWDTHDVAVIVLDQPVNLPAYAELPPVGLADSLPMKTDLTFVGYGIHGLVRGGGKPFTQQQDFVRYFAPTQYLTSQNPQSGEYLKLTSNPAQGKGGVCFGDSGGPALLGNTVLGTTTYGLDPNCAGVSYSNRLDLPYALDFIRSFLE